MSGERRTNGQSGRPEEMDPGDVRRYVSEHYHALYGYAFRLSGSEVDAEDLVQQTFLIAQQRGHQIQKAEAARSWLYTVLRNCFFKQLRKAPSIVLDENALDLDGLAEVLPQEEWFDREELQNALDQLPADYRVVVVMFYYEQCSYREIAEKLEVPLGTVMSRLSRAKRRLRDWLCRQPEHAVTGEPTDDSDLDETA